MRRFLRYAWAQALFMGVVGSWIALLSALIWGVERVSPHWSVTVIGMGLVVLLGTSALMYGMFETARGRRFSDWFIRHSGPQREERR